MPEGLAAAGVGHATSAPNARLKVTGRGRFPPDYRTPGMVVAAVLRSDVAHARVTSIDVSRALGMEGVVAVATRSDLGMDRVVRHYGDVIAAVAAVDWDSAQAAVSEIEFDLERLPALADPEDAIESRVRLDPHSPSNLTLRVDHDVGDVAAGMRESDVVHEHIYTTGRPTHCNLSRRTCIARVDDDGSLEIMTSVDAPFFAREELARWLDMPAEKIRIVLPDLLTSSFGGRTGINRQCEPIAARLALLTEGRPVRLMYEPEEEFVAGTTRHPMQARITSGATKEGDLLALEIDLLADHGPYPDFVSRIVLSASRDRPIDLYAPRHYRFRGRAALTNNLLSGEMRGIGATQICHLLGIHMDELARRLDLDPVAFHLRNLSPTARSSLTACLDQGGTAFGWESPGRDAGGLIGRGVGLGCHTTGLGTFHGPDRATASLTLRSDGQVEIRVAAPDSGQGSATIWTQILAQELGVSPERVAIRPIDTATAPSDPWGSIASRTTYVVGSAVKSAAEQLREKLLAIEAGEHRGDDGSSPSHPASESRAGESFDLEQIARRRGPLTVSSEAVTEANPPTFGAYFAEVEVDPDTGVVHVRRFVAALDVGFAMNPAQCRGQIEGAIAMGLEFALKAEVVVKGGVPENVTLVDYPVALSDDMPEIEVVLVERAEETGPYGARGIGTPSLTPVMPAIANAVRDALGVRLSGIPMTPEDVWSALGRGGRSGREGVV